MNFSSADESSCAKMRSAGRASSSARSTFLYSREVMRRRSSGKASASPQGRYCPISEKRASVSSRANFSTIATLSSVHSGSTRWRTMHPRTIFSPSNSALRRAMKATAGKA